MDLDDLLADLQSAIPEAEDGRQSSGSGKYDQLPELPGTGREEEMFDVPPGYDAPALTPPPQEDEEDAYSTVTHAPRYIPKDQRGERGGDSPPPKPRRTDRPPDYVSTSQLQLRKQEGGGGGGGGGGEGAGGLEELDNLLALLSTTQQKQETPPEPHPSTSRTTVAQFMDELSEVERKVTHDDGDHAPRKATPRVTASTATQELDMLMADLSDFKMPPQQQPPPPAPLRQEDGPYAKLPAQKEPRVKSQLGDLDSMLGSLQTNMNKQGVDTSSKGTCAACDKPIFGKVINAMKRAWHPEHFTCAQCDTELGTVTFYEYKGTPYCEKDYHELFAPRCAYCNGPILDRCMRALDKTWHPEHFFCTLCGKHFGPEGFHAKDSKAYCRECYYEKFAPRCRRCDKAIMEGFITALGSQWHPECFCCKVCSVTFPQGDYYDFNGEPHCEIHYHAQRGTLCAQCQKPITGQCVSAMGKKFHPDHFTCAFCLKLLNKGTFKEHRNNAYCQPCFIKLFG